MERARFARRGVIEMLNSRGAWEPRPALAQTTLGEAFMLDVRTAAPEENATPPTSSARPETPRWRPALALARTLEQLGFGNLCKLESAHGRRYGREAVIGTRREDFIALAPWLRRHLRKPRIHRDALQHEVVEHLPRLMQRASAKGHTVPPEVIIRLAERGEQILARQDFARIAVSAYQDGHGRFLIDPLERRELPYVCRDCPELTAYCQHVEITPSPAYAWRQLGLIDVVGVPTPRGILFSYFHHGEGLAIAAAIEDEGYPIEELVFDLANLRAGPRFAGEDSPYGGRLGALCQRVYDRADLPGYLEMGVPLDYGAGASEVVHQIVEHGTSRTRLLTESLRQGDIERALIEWRSLLRHITWAPDYNLARWRALKKAAVELLEKSVSPAGLTHP